MSNYPAFGSIPRLHRHFTITEKIDGTNGLIAIFEGETPPDLDLWAENDLADENSNLIVAAGSRNRWLTDAKGDDNHGFAAWVRANAATLAEDLGPGMHFGEWWGSGIARGYGLPKGEKRFSLFNTKRWSENGRTEPTFETSGLDVVPVLFDSESSGDEGVTRDLNWEVDMALMTLERSGSSAAPGFMRPEGIIVYHKASGQYFKATLEKDDIPKSVAVKQQREQKVSA